MFNWLFGYEEPMTWCEKQRNKKYQVLKQIETHIFILQNHVHSDLCKCPEKYLNVCQRLPKKKNKKKK